MKECKNCTFMRIYEAVDDPQRRLCLCEDVDDIKDGAVILREVSNFNASDCLVYRSKQTGDKP